MENEQAPGTGGSDGGEYKRFATKRIVAGIFIAGLVIWMASVIVGFFDQDPAGQTPRPAATGENQATGQTAAASPGSQTGGEAPEGSKGEAPAAGGDTAVDRYKTLFDRHVAGQAAQPAAGHGEAPAAGHGEAPAPGHEPAAAAVHEAARAPGAQTAALPPDQGSDEPLPKETAPEPHPMPAPAPHGGEAPARVAHGAPAAPGPPKARGVAFVEALIRPLDHEVNHRFWGWRPNDIINVTDNVNNFQLGVLEATRRTTIVLTERISRIGTTASFDDNMEQAMNWFMIKASTYWLPSPESKYNEGLDHLRKYARTLETGVGRFYTRTDNLIPLLSVYQDLLGSCDENLVKAYEDDGEEVSFFKADNYFYYAQGVASTLLGILEAIQVDFDAVLESRKARDAIHHAVESLHHAMEIKPWIILNSGLSSMFANHRANIAAPISHARFYLGVAIGALST